ncbi:Replication factor C subunit 1 [Zancudomyces culisetae]|uniref:Replication factor C subunit 1 n=1 Tax=Zancudomyces culisetae TaxID=1213189 RepID=A0A1R1PUZ2_ZANCU|nr:Replication factor C subunit 1 [Zancudomyces culisetae]|eukprot:OMH84794.1 Replication factor C subunit 1 [Zancudomyces culisetae]
MTFVITGELPSYSRETVADVIKRYGGRVTSAVSSKTTFLILGDSPGSSKITSAKKHNVSALDEDGFVGLVESFREDSGEDKNVKDLGSNQMDIDETNTKDAQDIKTEKAEGIATVGKKSAAELVKAVEKIVIDKSIREEEMREAKQEPAESTKQGGKKQQQPEMVADSELWVDKYKPKTLKEVCGNKTAIDRVYNWLSSW